MAKKFFIIAGEASGDFLGSKLIAQIKNKDKNAEFIGVGGDLMKKQGFRSIFDMDELSIMGFFEVLPHIAKILGRIEKTARVIKNEKPDYVITIDSPDFCFRVVKRIQGFEVKKIHLIAPSVWAYREGRAEKISKLYDLLLCILPFEPPYFEKYGLKTKFIGHPICENIEVKKREINNNITIAITPGSRISEVKKIFPEFIGAINLLAKKRKNLKVVIPLIDKTKDLVKEMAQDLEVKYDLIEKEKKKSIFSLANYALAKSGTNALEFSLHKIPIIVAYKINALTHFFAKRMIKIQYANLINLILDKEVIPELLQDKCQAKKIADELDKLIDNEKLAKNQIKEGEVALKEMGYGSEESSSEKAINEILKL